VSSKTLGRPPYDSVSGDDLQDEHEELQTEHGSIQSDTDAMQIVLDAINEEVEEIEQHIHTRERWFGQSVDQSGNDWAADNLTPLDVISGDDEYGADADDEAKCIGTADTPVIAGMTKFDLHRILIVGVSQNSVYKMRFVFGTGTMADAITAEQTSEFMVKFDAVNPQQSAGIPFEVKMPRLNAGTKVWLQAWNATNNATASFFIGLHEYLE
jgi:hypothetical protein